MAVYLRLAMVALSILYAQHDGIRSLTNRVQHLEDQQRGKEVVDRDTFGGNLSHVETIQFEIPAQALEQALLEASWRPDQVLKSKALEAHGHQWRIEVYPRGTGDIYRRFPRVTYALLVHPDSSAKVNAQVSWRVVSGKPNQSAWWNGFLAYGGRTCDNLRLRTYGRNLGAGCSAVRNVFFRGDVVFEVAIRIEN